MINKALEWLKKKKNDIVSWQQERPNQVLASPGRKLSG
jgi:hypothetical protein